MAKIKITTETTLSDKEFTLTYYEFDKPGNNGGVHGQKNEIYFRPDGVTVLLVDEAEGKMLFTKQVRLATYLNGNSGAELVETCAGTIDEGEDPTDTVYREVLEETGYRVKEVKKVMQGYPSPGGVTEIIHFYMGSYDSTGPKEKGGGADGEGEEIELLELSISQVRAKLEAGWFIDLKTILLLQHYFLSCKLTRGS